LPLALVGLGVAAALGVLGLPPVDVHGPWHYVGVMDPLCGGTRSLEAMARGRIGRAWAFNPLSVVLFFGAFAALARYGVGRVTRCWVTVRLPRGAHLWAWASALTVALEANQQLHAALLMR
jgi:hypothetical protein